MGRVKKIVASKALQRRAAELKNTAELFESIGWVRPATAKGVAKDLRALADVFVASGPGHAAVLRSLASRLDG